MSEDKILNGVNVSTVENVTSNGTNVDVQIESK